MADYDYGQLIDDFELGVDVMPDEDLTAYIERRRREFESKADGGSIGIEVLFQPKRGEYQKGGRTIDSRATAQDYANALQRVSAGTTYQQQADAKRYARNQANQMLTNTMRSGNQANIQNLLQQVGGITSIPGMQFNRSGNRVTSIPSTGAGRDAIVNALANQMLNTTSYAAPKPRPKTYRTVSPEAQALNMSQSTYEDIIRSGKDPKQYYMDYQNRIMAGNPNLLKYGQVIGGPGMMSGIAGPGMGPGATPPTQAQINQMISNNPMGYADFDALVKTYSADPYKGLKEEIKDMVGGRDTGYMSAQDYYDINVLGLDGKGIAEKYGLQYADGGRVGLFMGGDPLTGQALSIYDSMKAYNFSDQEIANALSAQGLYTAPGSSTPETTAPNIINQQLQTGGGGDNNFGGQGIGAFGNLDPNTKQTMQVEVADGMGGVKIKEVDTYLTAGGLRRTLDNKNPVNLGLDIKPMAVTIMEALMGKKTDDEFDPEGKILGPFNNPNYKDMSFFGKIKADASRQKELKQLQKEFELQEKLKAQIAEEQKQAAATQVAFEKAMDQGRSFYDQFGKGDAASSATREQAGAGYSRSDDSFTSSPFAKGGLATMFKKKR